MSCSVTKPNMFRTIIKRGYAAQPAVKSTVNGQDFEVSTSTKGSRLVAINGKSPLIRVSLSYKAGTRFEKPDNYGISHVLRAAVVKGTSAYTPFFLHRNLQQYGINVYCSTDRETVTYTAETHQAEFGRALNFLTEVGVYPAFKPWEILDNRDRVKMELGAIAPEAKVFDLLHKAAYKTGLGNSLYCEESKIGKINYEHLLQFYDELFTFPRLQVTAYGADLSILESYITDINLPEEAGPAAEPSPYYGGQEYRIPNYKENIAHIAIVGPAPGYTKKEYLAYAILKYVYGAAPYIKYGENHGILNKAVGKLVSLASVSGLNISYSDSSLVGFYLLANASDSGKALEAVLAAFEKADISDKDIAKAKSQFKTDILLSSEGANIVDTISRQIAADSIVLPEQLLSAIDSLSSADIKQAAKKVASSKLSAVYYGDIANVPDLVQLKK